MLSLLPFNILHFFPGYVRLRVKEIKNNPGYGKSIEDILMTIRGITEVKTNPSTGSILIRYNPGTIDVESLIKIGIENRLIPDDKSFDIEYIKKILIGAGF